MKQLGPLKGHSLLLVADPATDWRRCLEAQALGEEIFGSCQSIMPEYSVSGWIAGANSLFFAAALHVEQNHLGPWVWMEPDAIPLRTGWLDAVQDAYAKCGKRFMGAVIAANLHGQPHTYMNGVAVYPENLWNEFRNAGNEAFDVVLSRRYMPECANSALFQCMWGQKDLPPTFTIGKYKGGHVYTKQNLDARAVIFHRNKDGTLQNLLGGVSTRVYAHGGDVGDLIYGLPAMQAMGKGVLALHVHGVREQFSQAKVDRLAPLLKLQPYLEDVVFMEKKPHTKYDFNPFREKNWDARNSSYVSSLAETQCDIMGVPRALLWNQWLWVDKLAPIDGKPVVVHRSPRYHNRAFPWKEVVKKYHNRAVFIGMPDEHQAFCAEFGMLPYYPTKDYLELARVIAGSQLFIGNQSCPYAIAEGMKRPAILESMQGCMDCQFYRHGLQNDPQGNISLPDL